MVYLCRDLLYHDVSRWIYYVWTILWSSGNFILRFRVACHADRNSIRTLQIRLLSIARQLWWCSMPLVLYENIFYTNFLKAYSSQDSKLKFYAVIHCKDFSAKHVSSSVHCLGLYKYWNAFLWSVHNYLICESNDWCFLQQESHWRLYEVPKVKGIWFAPSFIVDRAKTDVVKEKDWLIVGFIAEHAQSPSHLKSSM